MGGIDRAVSLRALCHNHPPQPPRMSLSERRLLYVAMTRAKDDLHLLVPQRFFVHGQASKGDRHLYASRTRFISEALLPNFERTAWPVVTATRASHPARRLKWTSRRICGACGAKRPCRRRLVVRVRDVYGIKCSATDKLFGNSLSVGGTSAWRERRLSPIRCYGPNRLRLRQLISFFFFAYQSKTDSIFSESVSHWPTPNSSLLIKPAGCNERPLLRHKRPITTDKLLLEIYPVTKPYQCTKSTAFLGRQW